MQIDAQMNHGPNLEGVTILVVILYCVDGEDYIKMEKILQSLKTTKL
jgi:hypothetical protein